MTSDRPTLIFACHVHFDPPLPEDILITPMRTQVVTEGPVAARCMRAIGRDMIRVYGPLHGEGGHEAVGAMAGEIVDKLLGAGVDPESIGDPVYTYLSHDASQWSILGTFGQSSQTSGAGETPGMGAGESAPASGVGQGGDRESKAEAACPARQPYPTADERAADVAKLREIVGANMMLRTYDDRPSRGSMRQRARSESRRHGESDTAEYRSLGVSESAHFASPATWRHEGADDEEATGPPLDWAARDMSGKIQSWENFSAKTPRAAAGAGESAPRDAAAAAPPLVALADGLGVPPQMQEYVAQLGDRLHACLAPSTPALASPPGADDEDEPGDAASHWHGRTLAYVVESRYHHGNFLIDVTTWYLGYRKQRDGKTYICLQGGRIHDQDRGDFMRPPDGRDSDWDLHITLLEADVSPRQERLLTELRKRLEVLNRKTFMWEGQFTFDYARSSPEYPLLVVMVNSNLHNTLFCLVEAASRVPGYLEHYRGDVRKNYHVSVRRSRGRREVFG